jgi:hypothetical protein
MHVSDVSTSSKYPDQVLALQTSDGFKYQVLGFSPAVGKCIQVHAEAFDTGYVSLRAVVTKSFAV